MSTPALYRNVGVLAAAQVLFFMGNTIMMSTSSLVGLQLAPSPAMATVPLGLQFFGTMVTTFPASLLMRRIGRRGGFLIGTASCAAGGTLAALAVLRASFPLFCLGSFLYGVFAAFAQYYRFAAADAGEQAPLERRSATRARAISWVMAGGVVAAVAGPELARATRELFPPYLFAGSYLAVAALGLVGLVVVSLLRLPRPHLAPGAGHGPPLAAILRRPAVRTAILTAILAYVTMNLLMTATPLAMLACGHAFSDTARVIQAHVLGMFAPSFVTGHLIARFGSPRIILTGALLTTGCVLVALSGVEVTRFALALFLLGVGWNFMFIGATSLLTEHHDAAEKAKVQGFNDLAMFTAVTLSATSSGALHDLLGWSALNLLALPALLVVAMSVLGLARAVPARSSAG